MECGKGYRSLYAWGCILFGRELLSKGLIKSIGDETTTSMLSQKWVMDEIPRWEINKETVIDVNLKVSSLIQDEGQWDGDKLKSLFPVNEVTRIMQLSVGNVSDRDIWAYTSHGSFTVKAVV